jgi:hypothetical protein
MKVTYELKKENLPQNSNNNQVEVYLPNSPSYGEELCDKQHTKLVYRDQYCRARPPAKLHASDRSNSPSVNPLPQAPNDLQSSFERFKSVSGTDFMFYEALGEDLIYLLRAIYINYNLPDRVSRITEAVLIFVRLRTNKSALRISLESLDRCGVLGEIILDFIESLIDKCCPTVQLQSLDDISDKVNLYYDILNKFTSLKDTLIYQKVQRLLTYSISFGVCEKFGISFSDIGYTNMEANIVKQKFKFGPTFLVVMLDTFLYILKKGIQVIKTGDIDCIYHSGDTYGALFDSYYKLKQQQQQLHNPELFGFNLSSFQSELDDTIEKFANVKKHTNGMSKYDKESVNRCYNDLLLWRTDFITKKSSRKLRKAPFSVLFFGESGVGKTYLKEIMFNFYGKFMGLETKPDFCYTLSPGSKYWDGFRSSMWCIVLDDIGFPHPDKCPNGDESYQFLIQVRNNQPFSPNQAALEDKGKTPVLNSLLVATTNIKHLNAAAYFSHASAVQRRLPIVVTPHVKPEYAKSDGMLDRSKIQPSVPGCYDDYWFFDVDTVQAVLTTSHKKNAEYVRVREKCNLRELLLYLKEEIVLHNANQDKFMAAIADMEDIEFCTRCDMPKQQFCECLRDPTYHELLPPPGYHSSYWINKAEELKNSPAINPDNDGFFAWVSRTMDKYFPPKREKYEEEILKEFVEEDKPVALQGRIELHLTCISYILIFLAGIYFLCKRQIQIVKADAQVLSRAAYYPRRFYQYYDNLRQRTLGHDRLTREYWVDLGNRTRDRIVGRVACKSIGFVIIVLTAIYAIVKITNKVKKIDSNFQGSMSVTDIGSKPKPLREEKPDIWINNDIHLSRFDLTPQITSNKTEDVNVFLNRIGKNCVSITVDLPNQAGVRVGKAVCLRGNLYVTNNHNIPTIDDRTHMKFVHLPETVGVNGNIVFKLSERDIVRYLGNDICIFTVSGVPPKRGIHHLLPKKSVNTHTNGYLLMRDTYGIVRVDTLRSIKLEKQMSIQDDHHGVDTRIDIWSYICSRKTIHGDCGAMVVIDTPMGKMVGGIHVLEFLDNDRVAATALYQEFFEEILDQKSMYSIQGSHPLLSSETAQRELDILHPKANIRFLREGTAEVFGSFKGFRRKPKSTVGVSPLAPFLTHHGYKIRYGKPELSSWEPWNLALLDLTNPLLTFDSAIVCEIALDFKNDILKGVNDTIKEVIVLDFFTAVNGAEGVCYIDKIKRNTSAGAPWNKSKKYFLKPIEPQFGLLDPVEVTPEIRDRCQVLIDRYSSGERSSCVYMAHLKDEAVSFAKVKAKKTRVFCGAPMDQTIVTRMFLLSTIRFVQNNKLLFESAPGIVAQSSDWEHLYKYITQFGDDMIIAGDYRKFDKTMPAEFILQAFDILRYVCELSGNYTQEQLRVIEGIAVDTAYALCDFNGDLIQFYGGNPSGHALTVIINGLVNSLYMRYAYRVLNPDKICSTFKENVSLMTYGDDNLMGVSRNIPWFNHTSISELFATYGLGYTMADKDAMSIPYIHISDASFLKRGFRYDSDTGFCFAPIELESIEKSLMVWTFSKSVCKERQAVDIVSSALGEYFFWGKDVFEEKSKILRNCLIESGMMDYITDTTFLTWDNHVDRFIQASVGRQL